MDGVGVWHRRRLRLLILGEGLCVQCLGSAPGVGACGKSNNVVMLLPPSKLARKFLPGLLAPTPVPRIPNARALFRPRNTATRTHSFAPTEPTLFRSLLEKRISQKYLHQTERIVLRSLAKRENSVRRTERSRYTFARSESRDFQEGAHVSTVRISLKAGLSH